MDYQEFKKAYTDCFNRMMGYKPTEVGSQIYCEKMAALADQYPEFAERAENE